MKTELTASIRHIEIFLKSGISIYNSKVPDTAGRNTRRRRTQVIAKRYAFHANAIKIQVIWLFIIIRTSVCGKERLNLIIIFWLPPILPSYFQPQVMLSSYVHLCLYMLLKVMLIKQSVVHKCLRFDHNEKRIIMHFNFLFLY